MKKTFLKALCVLLMASCTTEYLKDSAEVNDKVGYNNFSSDEISYKDVKRKDVTVMKPLIEPINEKTPDLVALPVDKVSVVELDKKSLEKEKEVEFVLNNSDLKPEVVEDKQEKNFFKDALALLSKSFEKEEYKDTPEENEKVAQEPPKSPEILGKQVSISKDDIIPLIEKEVKKDEEYSNILTLINSLKFNGNKASLSVDDFEKIKEAAEIQKEDGGRIKVIVYSPLDCEKTFENIVKTREDNILIAINNFGINKDKLVSVIEKTDASSLINSAEIYIEY